MSQDTEIRCKIAENANPIHLLSSNDRTVAFHQHIICISNTLRTMIQTISLDPLSITEQSPIEVTNISSEILEKIALWLTLYIRNDLLLKLDVRQQLLDSQENVNLTSAVSCSSINKSMSQYAINEANQKTISLKQWEVEFLNFGNPMLCDLIVASEYLDIEPLTDLCCKFIALQIRNKSVDQLRRDFGIENDLTTEEEAEIKIQHDWCNNL